MFLNEAASFAPFEFFFLEHLLAWGDEHAQLSKNQFKL